MTTTKSAVPTGSIRLGHDHPGCPGVIRASIRVGTKKVEGQTRPDMRPGLMYCNHPSHEGETLDRCLDCGERGVELTDFLACVDVDGCEERRVSHRTGKVWEDLRASKAAAQEAKDEKAAADRVRRAAQAREGQGEGSERPRKAKEADPLGGRCNHCGLPTKGGRFVAGHDAKLKGELMRAATDESGLAGRAFAATLEIIARGWLKRPQLINSEVLKAAEDQYQEMNDEQVNLWLADRNRERWATYA